MSAMCLESQNSISVLVLPLEIFIEDTPLHRREHIKHVLTAQHCGPTAVKCCHGHALHVSIPIYIYIYMLYIYIYTYCIGCIIMMSVCLRVDIISPLVDHVWDIRSQQTRWVKHNWEKVAWVHDQSTSHHSFAQDHSAIEKTCSTLRKYETNGSTIY